MENLNGILLSVGRISDSDHSVGEQINMISEMYGISPKVSTILHFAAKDGKWNPTSLEMLSDVVSEISINEVVMNDKENEKLEFYLMNYIETKWGDVALKHVEYYKKFSLFNIWLRKLTSEIIRDVEIIGIYPEDKSEFIVDRNFPGDGLVHPPVSEWLTNIIRKVTPEYRS